MPRSTIAKRQSVTFDKSLELRNHQLPAINASSTETAIAFPSSLAEDFYAACFCSVYTGYTLDISEWQVVIEVSLTLTGTYRQVGIAKLAPGKEVQVPLSGYYIDSILSNAAYVRARTLRVGAPGALTYGAFLATEVC
jgi:hypothetical protein